MTSTRTPDPVLVIGSKGQVGQALVRFLGNHCISWDRSQLDLAAIDGIQSRLKNLKVSAVINAAAYNHVDRAQSEPKLARTINALAPEKLAIFCRERDLPLVYYSTDYVFPGSGDQPWQETDGVRPLNVYGSSKVEGEERISQVGGKYIVFRTSWVFSAFGHNFMNSILESARRQPEMRVVSDQVGSPTYADHLAQGTLAALKRSTDFREFPSGVYHLTNSGYESRFGFAERIFSFCKNQKYISDLPRLNPISSGELQSPAMRPLNSRLNTTKAKRVFELQLPHWEEALEICLNLKFKSKQTFG